MYLYTPHTLFFSPYRSRCRRRCVSGSEELRSETEQKVQCWSRIKGVRETNTEDIAFCIHAAQVGKRTAESLPVCFRCVLEEALEVAAQHTLTND
jgi:hypothetical protein